jgi:hypothetical protein
MKSEFAQWRDELNPPPKATVAERLARWFERPAPAQPCPFVWRSVADLVPIAEEAP